MTFDEKLVLALRDTARERSEQMAVVTKKHRFSLSYKLWKRKVLKNLRKTRYDSRWTLHKARRIVVAAFVVSIVLFAATACAVVGLTVGRFSFEDKREYSKLFLASLSSDKTQIEEYYGLPIENGWKINDFYADDYGTSIVYVCGEKIVSFRQDIIRGNMGNVNTEKAAVEPVSLYEENDGFVLDFGNNGTLLYWIYDGYLLSFSGNIDKTEAVNLAYSTKLVEF